MGIFEETHIDPLIKQKVQLYVRYIDDIFFIWKGSKNEIQQFISKINEVHPSIKVDFNYSKAQITFLRHNNNKSIYRKNFNNTIQKRNQSAILFLSKIAAPSDS